ncbi:MAG: hypothetical protein KIT84_32975 [Labilithrix sp.]|nr:hypothetical protein [Labilithrix sp.]MCW5815889.1 hypothetical protein [Labilithrix sp.]
MQRHSFRSARLAALVVGSAALSLSGAAHAQVAGTSSRPLPDVLLLVDNSGSMERMPNNKLPGEDPGTLCDHGVMSEPNRWGMLLQALTGNIQPFFSCAARPRGATEPFAQIYKINNQPPYDVGYAIPYHQPTSGNSPANACAITPWHLPGASSPNGVGPNGLGAGGLATDFPDNALASVLYNSINNGLIATDASGLSRCTFEQTNDGQLDVARDFARFALMMFDSDTSGFTGVTTSGSNTYIDIANPFTGTWSYHRRSTSADYNTRTCIATDADCPVTVFPEIGWTRGRPTTAPPCPFTPQEVGARNRGAPPWEGRLVPFPDPDANLYELGAQNEHVQQVLLASRPWGATPIDGMLDDARTFLWDDPAGPRSDPYGCRDKYIVLLTDGAPNLDLRGAGGCAGTDCPYERGSVIANDMFTATDPLKKVTTFVIGFSVNGVAGGPAEGLPTGVTSCKGWFDQVAASASSDHDAALAMQAACTPPPTEGTTGYACCKLNELALAGSETSAFFAESQADIVLAFGRIMANIIRSASTKTIPVMSPSTRFSASATAASPTAVAGQFHGTFIPSSQRPWSGEIDRTRFVCKNDPITGKLASLPDDSQLASKGDFMSENLAKQTEDNARFFLSVVAGDAGDTSIDSSASVRPYANAGTPSSTGADPITKPGGGAPTYGGTEVAMPAPLSFPPAWPAALGITEHTCKRGRAVQTGGRIDRGTTLIPALDGAAGPAECTSVVWGFATAVPTPLSFRGYDFNVRCRTSESEPGKCSISGDSCVPHALPATCPSGEVCVARCAALGAVYHANPAIVPPPQSLLREDGFRDYQANRAARRTVLYAATTDGILHAFKALDEGGTDAKHELWAFVPPAVLPRLASNYPGGNQILLDGTPVVRETVWDRPAAGTQAASQWHSTLVAGIGTTGGYYALNVTDADCGGDCTANHQTPTSNDIAQVSTSGDTGSAAMRGPHFLWQLTDVPQASATDPAKEIRRSTIGNTPMVALFGKHTSTPAVGTVVIRDAADVDRQVGIAILPGGYDEPPITGQTCPRRAKPTTPDESGADYSDRTPRTDVRRWARGDCTQPVPGRGVTVVRLDNGEIIAHFGRANQDVPALIGASLKMIDTPLDSPMVGTPVVFPDQVGVPIQKAFIGDADGTLWRIDFTSTDPRRWRMNLFSDLYAVTTAATPGLAGHPIQVPPVLSLDESGSLIINVATGDQESMVASSDTNYVFSIREVRDASSFPKASTLWWQVLPNSERVTGPMTVFDRILYFASYQPRQPATGSAICTGLGLTKLWGLHYTAPFTDGDPTSGGRPEWCQDTDIDSVTGLCAPGASKVANVIPVDSIGQPISDIIPGVTLTASSACSEDAATDEYGNMGYQSVASSSYSLTFGITRPGGAGRNTQADRKSVSRPLPKQATKVDSWALVLQ